MRFHLDPRREIVFTLLGLALAWVSLSAATAQEPERFYYYFDKKIPVTVSTEKVGFFFDRDLPAQAKRGLLNSEADLGDFVSGRFASGLELVSLKPGMNERRVMAMTRRLAARSGVRHVSPILKVGEGEAALTDQIAVKFRPGLSRGEAEAIGALYDCELVRISYSKDPENPHFHVFRAIDPDGDNPLTIANRFHEDRDVLFACPDFQVLSINLHSIIPDDTYFSPGAAPNDVGQWQLHNPGATGKDVDAPEAWQFMADSGINLENMGAVIAILDQGVDVNHEDLNLWVNWQEFYGEDGVDDDCNGYVDDVNGWNFFVTTDLITNNNCNDNPPKSRVEDVPEGDPSTHEPIRYARHGTWVAGVAAARTNNGKGVAGVAWGARVMALRIINLTRYELIRGVPVALIREYSPTTGIEQAEAIYYAIDNGADVLNNSWGAPYPLPLTYQAIIDARFGRNGRGAIVVFSSGNASSVMDLLQSEGLHEIADPGNRAQVISVGMSNDTDERQTASNGGLQLDVVAPSGQPGLGSALQKLYSTDVPQNYPTGLLYSPSESNLTTHNGLNSGNPAEPDSAGLYTWAGSGTSGAAPFVSGLAGLLVQLHPELTATQVRAIIQFSADDLVSQRLILRTSTNEDQPGRDRFMGYGRISAEDAVRLASAQPLMELKNSDGRHVMSLIEGGHLVLEGNIIFNASTSAPDVLSPVSSDLLILRNNDATPLVVARVDELGDLYLKGDLYERLALAPSPAEDDPLILLNDDSSPQVMAFLDGDGNFKIVGNAFLARSIYEGSVDSNNLVGPKKGEPLEFGGPDRENSHGDGETRLAYIENPPS